MAFVKYVTDIKNYSRSNLCPLVSKSKTFDPKGGKRPVNYIEGVIRYRHSTPDGVVPHMMLIQGPTVTVDGGIRRPDLSKMEDREGKQMPRHVAIKLVGENEVVANLLTDVRDWVIESIMSHPQDFGPFGAKCDSIATGRALLQAPFSAKTDSVPTKFLSLIEYDGVIKTVFTRPTSNKKLVPIPADVLYDKTIVITPTYYFKRVYLGTANPSVQVFLDSAIVSSVAQGVSIPVHIQTAERLVDENPAEIAKLDAMFPYEDKVSAPAWPASVKSEHGGEDGGVDVSDWAQRVAESVTRDAKDEKKQAEVSAPIPPPVVEPPAVQAAAPPQAAPATVPPKQVRRVIRGAA